MRAVPAKVELEQGPVAAVRRGAGPARPHASRASRAALSDPTTHRYKRHRSPSRRLVPPANRAAPTVPRRQRADLSLSPRISHDGAAGFDRRGDVRSVSSHWLASLSISRARPSLRRSRESTLLDPSPQASCLAAPPPSGTVVSCRDAPCLEPDLQCSPAHYRHCRDRDQARPTCCSSPMRPALHAAPLRATPSGAAWHRGALVPAALRGGGAARSRPTVNRGATQTAIFTAPTPAAGGSVHHRDNNATPSRNTGGTLNPAPVYPGIFVGGRTQGVGHRLAWGGVRAGRGHRPVRPPLIQRAASPV